MALLFRMARAGDYAGTRATEFLQLSEIAVKKRKKPCRVMIEFDDCAFFHLLAQMQSNAPKGKSLRRPLTCMLVGARPRSQSCMFTSRMLLDWHPNARSVHLGSASLPWATATVGAGGATANANAYIAD